MIFDMIIYNGTIVTVNPDFDILDNGLICINNGKIVQIENLDESIALPEAKTVINAKNNLIMPGLINTHTHLPMTLFRGLADDLSLHTWLNEHIFPAEAKYINHESVYYSSMLACAEMLLSGTTTCCDGYFLENEVAKAVNKAGIRAVLGHGVIDFPAPGVPDPLQNIRIAEIFVEKWMDKSPLITPSIFCHSPYTCSKETLIKAKHTAKQKRLLFQIHAAETKNEQDQFLSEHGITSIEYMDKLGILDKQTLLVHSVWLNNNDIKIIADCSAKISHNPESNMKLASGIAPVPKFLNADITTGIGTDGCASNNNLDLFQEMDTAAKLHKVNILDPTIMDAQTVVKMATIEGAKAIGLGNQTGSLEIGKQADIIMIDINQPHLVPMYDPSSHIVYSIHGSDVKDVIIAGKIVVQNRQVKIFNINSIIKEIIRISEKIKALKNI